MMLAAVGKGGWWRKALGGAVEGPAAAVLPQQHGCTAQPRDVQLGPGMHSSIQGRTAQSRGVQLSPGGVAQPRDVQFGPGM